MLICPWVAVLSLLLRLPPALLTSQELLNGDMFENTYSPGSKPRLGFILCVILSLEPGL